MKKRAAAIVLVGLCMMSSAAFAGYTDSNTVKAVQEALNAAGFDSGKVDGLFGKKTSGAIRQYQEKNALTVTGEIDDDLLAAMKLSAGGVSAGFKV